MKTEDILQEGAVADVATAGTNPAATGSVEEAPGETGGEAAYGGQGGEAARLRLAPPDSLRRGAGEAGVAETKGGAGIRESETGDTARLCLATVTGEEEGSGAEVAHGTGALAEAAETMAEKGGVAEAGAEAEVEAGGVAEAGAEAEVETGGTMAEAGSPAGEAGIPIAGIPAAEVERLVDEAYRRGRNESIAELMARPGMLQPSAAGPGDAAAGAETGFLANRRPSIWDR